MEPCHRLQFWLYFYPRPPRGGRPAGKLRIRGTICISIHALREEGDVWHDRYFLVVLFISIHALREEGDRYRTCSPERSYPFLSTPSARRATSAKQLKSAKSWISIHALREEGDICAWRLPCSTSLFLSTPSARRATAIVLSMFCVPSYFYPRPPRGGRLHLL